MRVAHVITRLILGGAQENTLLTCADLIHRYGDDVLLIAGPGLGPEGSLVAQARDMRIPLALVPSLRRNIHPWRDLRSYRAIQRHLRHFAPQVVHTHSAKAGLLGRQAAWSLDVPAIVHTVHGAPFHPYQGRGARALFQACERYAARRCHALVSVADAMTDLMVAAKVAPRDKFTTIYSGFDTAPFLTANGCRAAMRARLGYREGQVVVGKIARLFRLKGHDALIDVAQRLLPAHPELQFLLVGDGVLRGPLQQRIDNAGLHEHFRFTGRVVPEQIPAHLAASDLIVHTSLREGLARILPQALIAGVPVISYDIDGAREVVIDGDTGRLVAPGDLSGLTEAIAALADDPQQRRRMGQAGRARFAEQFRHETMTERLRALYERLLERRGIFP